MKQCSKCRKARPATDFSLCRSHGDGLNSYCRDCNTAHVREWKKRNRERTREINAKSRKANPGTTAASQKRWKTANLSAVNAGTKKRFDAKRRATPAWLSQVDRNSIQSVYALAKSIRAVTGKEVHVDHVAPIGGANSCGLHVPWNLEIVTAKANASKGNKLPSEEKHRYVALGSLMRLLPSGECIVDPATVADLGAGSSEVGAAILDQWVARMRIHFADRRA